MWSLSHRLASSETFSAGCSGEARKQCSVAWAACSARLVVVVAGVLAVVVDELAVVVDELAACRGRALCGGKRRGSDK